LKKEVILIPTLFLYFKMNLKNNYMLSETSNITVVVIVLNNKNQIEGCINSIILQKVNKIIVIDGGSTDGTIEIIKKYPCELHIIGKTGLSHSRQFGVDLVKTDYVALVDSDNILSESCLQNLIDDLISSNFVGISAKKYSFDKENIYGLFQEWMNSKKVNKSGSKSVIGTPAVYKTKILQDKVRYNSTIKFGDDTDLCYRLSLNGYYVGTGSGICYEKMPNTFSEFYNKAYLYGKADLEFFKKNPSRRHDIGTHAIRNYFLKMTYHSFKDIKFYFLPLIFIYSFSRFIGLFYNLIFKK